MVNGTMQMQKVISLKAHKPSMGYMFTLTIMVYKLKILFLMVTTTIKILAHGKSSLVISLLKLVTYLYYFSSNGRTGNITIDGKDYYY